MFKNYIKTLNSVTLIFDNADPVNVLCTSPVFPRIKAALDKGLFNSIESILTGGVGSLALAKVGKFTVDENRNILIDGIKLPETLSKRLVKFVELGLDTKPLEKFWENLNENPSEDSKQDLFTFLEANHIPITQDGCFIGYKSVTSDFLDHHTKTISNAVGTIVTMPRAKVNADRNSHCSFGLHIAAFEYACSFNASGVLLEVKINPKNVVSVPTDHNAQKMRVCEYLVVAVHNGDKINEELRGHKNETLEPVPEKPIPAMTAKKSDQFDLNVGMDGRISVPRDLLLKIDKGNGDLFVRVENGKVVIRNFYVTNSNWTVEFPDSGAIRIPKSVSSVVGKNPTAKIVGKSIVIE